MPPPLPNRPMSPPLSWEQQVKRDAETLDLLAIFHFVYGGLGIVGTLFMAAYMFLFGAIFGGVLQQEFGKQGTPQEMTGLPYVFIGLFLMVALMLAAYSMTTIACGFYLKQRRHRMFTLVMAALHCASFPFGTALGVWTIVVLQRDAAKSLYTD